MKNCKIKGFIRVKGFKDSRKGGWKGRKGWKGRI